MPNDEPKEKQLDDLKPKDQTPMEAEQVKGGINPIDSLTKLPDKQILNG